MSKKVKQLAEVIALQEKTISKLQRIIENKKTKQTDLKKSHEIKKDSRYIVGQIADLLSVLTLSHLALNLMKQIDRIETHNQLSQISTDYIQDIQSLRGKIEGLQKERQDRSLFFQDKENWNNINNSKIETLEKQIKDRDSTITVLQEQLHEEKQLRQQTQKELQKQRATWNQMYSDLSNEIKTLKTELRTFSIQPKRKSNQLFFS